MANDTTNSRTDYSQGPWETPASQPRIDLNAKLHQGHDPDATHKHQGVLLSSVQYVTQPMLQKLHDYVTADVAEREAQNVMSRADGADATSIAQLTKQAALQLIGGQTTAFHIPEAASSVVGGGARDFAQRAPDADVTAGVSNGTASAKVSDAAPAAQVLASQRGDAAAASALQSVSDTVSVPAPAGAVVPTAQPPEAASPAAPAPTPTPAPSTPPTTTPNDTVSAPQITVSSLTALEDQIFSFPIQVTASSQSGVTTHVVIINVPALATLSAGTKNSDGSWTLTLAELPNLTITPPQDWSGAFTMHVTAVSVGPNNTASSAADVTVQIDAVADVPVLTVQAASGSEDNSIPLSISVSANDAVTVTIGNLPAGAILSAGTQNNDGTWTLTANQLSGLTLTPAANYHGDVNLSVTARSVDGSSTATTSATLPLSIDAVADTPVLTVQAASGLEDNSIPLNISVNAGDDAVTVTVGNLPAGATLSAGTQNNDGTWTLTPDQLTGLMLTPAAHYNGSVNLTISATSVDGTSTAMTSTSLPLYVGAVADAPTLTVQASTGNEDSAIALSIQSALSDPSQNETLQVVIGNVPAGASLSAGTRNHDGTWTLTPDQLSGLTLTPPAHWSGQLALDVTAITSENGTTASSYASLAVTVTGVATAPALSVTAASGDENTPIALAIDAQLVDTDNSETLTVQITGLPAGATLSAGTNTNGTWTLTPNQLNGLTLIPATNASGDFTLTVSAISHENGQSAVTSGALAVHVDGVANTPDLTVHAASGMENAAIAVVIDAALTDTDGSEQLTVVISGVPAAGSFSAGVKQSDGSWHFAADDLANLFYTPPANSKGDSNFTVTAISSENGTQASSTAPLAIHVDGIAHTPTLQAAPAQGNEDSAIALNVQASSADADDALSVRIDGVPAGATLSAGVKQSDGSWLLVTGALANLALNPPADFNGTITLTVTATASENGTTASQSTNLLVTISPVADAPVLTVQAASGLEDNSIPLSITVDAGDEAVTVTIGNLPAGATLSAGTHNNDGTWTLTADQLSGLTLIPAANYNGSVNLTVSATSVDGSSTATTHTTLPLTIGAVADAPVLTVQAASGLEDNSIPLSITVNAGDEAVTVTIGNLPAGATLSAGTQNNDGSWTLTPDQLSGLTLIPAANYNGSVNLTVSATSVDGSSTATTNATLPLSVGAVADTPVLTVQAASGDEDQPIALTIAASLTDSSEQLSIVISNVPAGAVLSAGTDNGDGSWTLTGAQLNGLTFTGPLNASGAYALHVTAIATDGSSVADRSATLNVTVAGVADTPSLAVQAATGVEHGSVPLSISASLTDSSEALSITVTGMPAGATLSAGTRNNDGSWTLTAGQLAGLLFTPAPYASGDYTLHVTATSTDGASAASITKDLAVSIAGVADTPSLSVQAASGQEDHAIALSISTASADIDGSETLSVMISGVPAAAVLSAGVRNNDGSWTLTPDQLSGLTVTPAPNYSGSFTLTVTSTATEQQSTASTSSSFAVTVAPVADTPTVSGQAVTGNEDTAIALNISSALADTSGSETLSITIGGMPAGASLSAGVRNSNGSWTLTSDQLSRLTLTPPANYSGSFNLVVVATAADSLSSATQSAIVPVTVVAVADAPTLSVQAASGNEDTAIALSINPVLVDTDNSETLSITITGVPAGAMLSAGTKNQDGSWSVTPDQLANLTVTPAANSDADFVLTVTATSHEANGSTAITTAYLPVTVAGVSDAPTLSVQAASGNEDTAIALTINPALVDTDNSETLSITIANLPVGATLSAGTNTNGVWTLTPDQLSGLKVNPPANFSGTMDLVVTAISGESGTTAQTQATLHVTVAGVADAPTLSVHAAIGQEDHAIALSITSALTDASESLSITITGVPNLAVLSAGTKNLDGSWTLSPSQLAGLTIKPPLNSDADFVLTVTATSTDGASTAYSTATLPVTVSGVADTPSLVLSTASGLEDNAIPLAIAATLTDTDGSETLTVNISGVPANAVLSAGTKNQDGSWTLSQLQLSGLTLTPPANYSGSFDLTVTAVASESGTVAATSGTLRVAVAGVADAPLLTTHAVTAAEDTAVALDIHAVLADTDISESLSITITGVPATATLSAGTKNANGIWTLTPDQLTGLTLSPAANYSGSFTLSVTATASENGTVSSTVSSVPVTITAVADAPTLGVQAASGLEDHTISLSITSALVDTDNSETLSITITGVPAAATLSAGTKNANGSWTLTPDQLAGLTLTPAPNSDADFTLTVTATSHEANGSTAITTAYLPVTVAGVADASTLSVQAASGNEDTAIALNISSALTDTDGSETLSLKIAGVPATATLSAGTKNQDGTWSVTRDQLSGLKLNPPANFSGTVDLVVTATSSESGTTAQTQATLRVTMAAVADAPTLSVQAAAGNEDTAIALNISAALTDTDNSETLSIRISGVPAAAVLSAGTKNQDGTWSLTQGQLAGLTLTPALHSDADFTLTVTATSHEANGSTAVTTAYLPVTVAGVADAPTLSVQAAAGNEDTAIALAITSAPVDTDGSETLSVRISNVPAGATLSAGTNNGNGTWTLTPDQLAGLKITPPANFSGAIDLVVTAISSESGTTAQTQATLRVTVAGVADAPTLSVQAASGNEDTAIALSINPALVDTDNSETLSVRISNLPDGASLSAGTNNGGVWTLTPAQLSGLSVIPPQNFSGAMDLLVTAITSEAGTTAQTQGTLHIQVTGVADTPNLAVAAASGKEHSEIRLRIESSLADNDGSESLSITISGVPEGAVLSAGKKGKNDSWTLSPKDLENLTITPPEKYSGSFNLTVTSTASEDGTVASRVVRLPVTVAAVAPTPEVETKAASGDEDSEIKLKIKVSMPDKEDAGVLSVVISDVPAGAQLSAGRYIGNDRWSLTTDELKNLTITPPANFSGCITLGVTVVNSLTGSVATATSSLEVTVNPVADAPLVSAQNVTGKEDAFIPLNITSTLTDSSEVLSIRITGVPSTATLSAGTKNQDGSWSVTQQQLPTLAFKQTANSDADAVLTVTATSVDGSGTATTSKSFNVTVEAVADVPTVTASNVTNTTAGAQVNLTINGAVTDSSETLTYLVQGVPDGFALNQGINNGDNSWTLTQAQLSGLKLTSPPGFNGQLTLYASSVSHDNDNSVAMSTPASFKVNVGTGASGYLIDLGVGVNVGGIGIGARVGAGPELELFPASGTLLGVGGVKTREDTPVLLSDAPNLLNLNVLNGLTSFIAKIVFSGIPTGTTFSAGTNKGGGVWEFSTTQLTGLTMTPAKDSDAEFTIVATARLLNSASLSLVSTPVNILGVADTPTLSVTAASGTEDTPAALTISSALTDTDVTSISETLSFMVSGMPTGFTLNKGINNGNGTWSLATADLTGLTVIPAANYSGAATFKVSAIATEREGDQAVRQQNVTMNFAAAADAPVIANTSLTGTEDNAIPLALGLGLTDKDGSETLGNLIISNLPAGATVTHATYSNGSWTVAANQLNNAAIIPPEHWSGDATFTVTATSTETSNNQSATLTKTINLHVDAVADAPVLSVSDAHGTQDGPIALDFSASLTDTDGSEKLSLVVSGMPEGTMLSAGLNNGDGSWTLAQGDLKNLTITPPEHFSGDMKLTATAYSIESGNASTASTQQGFNVHVDPSKFDEMDLKAANNNEDGWLSDSLDCGKSMEQVAKDAEVQLDVFAPSETDHSAGSGSEYDHAFQQHSG